MKYIITVSTLLFLFNTSVKTQHTLPVNKDNSIIIEGQIPPEYNSRVIELTSIPADIITYKTDEKKTIEKRVSNGFAKWKFPGTKPLVVYGSFFRDKNFGCLVEPGDSISVHYIGTTPVFTGRNAAKVELSYKIRKLRDSLDKEFRTRGLSYHNMPLKSLNDYHEWNIFLNEKIAVVQSLLNSYKDKVSPLAYNRIKVGLLTDIERRRVDRFYFLIGRVKTEDSGKKGQPPVNEFGLTNQNLCDIYDSTLNGPAARWLQYEAPFVKDPYYLYEILNYDLLRQKGKFFITAPSDSPILAKIRADRYVARYYHAKKKYKGIIREEVLSFFFHYIRGVLYNVGFEPKIEAILADYYAQSKYPEYVKATRAYELKQREKQVGKRDIDFTLTNLAGKTFTKQQIRGKIAILDFWFTGCMGCIQMAPALHKALEPFRNDTNVVVINVSVDKTKDLWQKGIAQNKYTTEGGIQLYTSGEGSAHPIIKNYGIDGYPSLLLFDANGRSIKTFSLPDPRKDGGRGLTELIQQQLVLMKDGPYVLDADSISTAYYLNGLNLHTEQISGNINTVTVQTDSRKTFHVKLKQSLAPEPAEFSRPEKIFALSDIEGNFSALRKLLQENKIIDSHFNWTYGNGHLVFAGDMFDRGDQVTECLWLIYSLEDKAKEAGGYVHFVLGNHEIMNLQGDHRYTTQKYAGNADIIGRKLTDLYGQQSELGRWLRTKNIALKLGDLLFVHGGISPRLNQADLSVQDINRLARPFYATMETEYKDHKVDVIMSQHYGPLWYRGYYSGVPMEDHVDSTLDKFAVNHIITGHTIVADTISQHFGGKVINTDTDHKNEKSEALYIEDLNFYRVNTAGERILLFVGTRDNTRSLSLKKRPDVLLNQ